MVLRKDFCRDTGKHLRTGSQFCEKGFDQNGYFMFKSTVKYDSEGYDFQGLDNYGFNRDGRYRNGTNKVCFRGFLVNGVHKKTKTIFDQYGYTRDGIDINGNQEPSDLG